MPNMKDILKTSIKNAVDYLNRFILVLAFLFVLISLFIRNFYIDLIKIILFIIFLFRLFSSNKNKRYRENQAFLKIIKYLTKPFDILKRNMQDKNHVYKKCPKCHTILKLPLPPKRGIKRSKCPKCGKKITFITFKREKIEIIKPEKKQKRSVK